MGGTSARSWRKVLHEALNGYREREVQGEDMAGAGAELARAVERLLIPPPVRHPATWCCATLRRSATTGLHMPAFHPTTFPEGPRRYPRTERRGSQRCLTQHVGRLQLSPMPVDHPSGARNCRVRRESEDPRSRRIIVDDLPFDMRMFESKSDAIFGVAVFEDPTARCRRSPIAIS
jgi:hypothetical protein